MRLTSKAPRNFVPGWVAASALALAPACVQDAAAPGPPPGDVAVWDFPAEPSPATTRVVPGGPKRSRHHLTTRTEDGRLAIVVDGADPFVVWHFDEAKRASAVRIDVESVDAGPLQLFWSTPKCPVFSEACSATVSLSAGRQLVDFLMDPAEPIRELRLDVADKIGARLTVHRMELAERPGLDAPWSGNAETALLVTPAGLEVQASSRDPWLTIATPGLDATRVDTVELTLRGAGGSSPQLFWSTPNGPFAENRSVRLSPADAGSLTHVARLKANPTWSGAITNLRLDPGESQGTYVLERLALVRGEVAQ